ncbi:MAG: hypothetical protein ACLQIQ_12825 [Beijerinckiaceae bacterium]
MNEQELTDLFALLGARDPAQWTHSQIKEGFPQLARFLFLRQAWKLVVPEADRSWIRKQANVDPNGPGGAIVPALGRLMAQGVDENDLTTVVRVMQWRLLFALCYLLDDPGTLEPEVRDFAWRLFQVDGNDRPIALMASLYESILETEPSGREMRP